MFLPEVMPRSTEAWRIVQKAAVLTLQRAGAQDHLLPLGQEGREEAELLFSQAWAVLGF